MQAVKRASHWLFELLATALPAAGATDPQGPRRATTR